jgi:hypothetical protein
MRCFPPARSPVDELTTRVIEAMEQAAMSGLCREGQLEIAAQTARELRPDLASAALLALVTEIYDRKRSGESGSER